MTENFPGPMAGKTALVTGGTGGIGRATAAGLAALGARVGITGRDKARTQAAATGIVRESGNPAVDAFAADMSCQAGVRALAAAVRSASAVRVATRPEPDDLRAAAGALGGAASRA
jgi:retinol dehydrogenase 14